MSANPTKNLRRFLPMHDYIILKFIDYSHIYTGVTVHILCTVHTLSMSLQCGLDSTSLLVRPVTSRSRAPRGFPATPGWVKVSWVHPPPSFLTPPSFRSDIVRDHVKLDVTSTLQHHTSPYRMIPHFFTSSSSTSSHFLRSFIFLIMEPTIFMLIFFFSP